MTQIHYTTPKKLVSVRMISFIKKLNNPSTYTSNMQNKIKMLVIVAMILVMYATTHSRFLFVYVMTFITHDIMIRF